MPKYEYMSVMRSSRVDFERALDEKGRQGWRALGYGTIDGEHHTCMERTIPEPNDTPQPVVVYEQPDNLGELQHLAHIGRAVREELQRTDDDDSPAEIREAIQNLKNEVLRLRKENEKLQQDRAQPPEPEELKPLPCPFCGSENIEVNYSNAWVRCCDCDSYGATASQDLDGAERKQDAIRLWNAAKR